MPVFMNGPLDTVPLNIATIRPVALTMRLFTGVNASMMGVYITPPPIPAKTAMTAIAKLRTKKPSSSQVMLLSAIPPGGTFAPLDIIRRAM
jgi:hypothetical protein